MPSTQTIPGYLFLIPWDLHHTGGVNQVVINLYQQAILNGKWRPMIFIESWNHQALDTREVDGRTTTYFRLRSPWGSRRPWLCMAAFIVHLPSMLFSLHRAVVRYRVGVVNVHYPHLSILIFSLLRKLGGFDGKLILSFHGTDVANVLETTGVERLLWKILLRSSDAIVTCCESLKRQLAGLVAGGNKKLNVVYNGVDAASLRAPQESGPLLAKVITTHKYILNVGNYLPVKGQDVLLDAFQRIANEFPELALVFVGGTGTVLGDLRERAQKYNLSDRVFFFEDVPHTDISAYYAHAQALCLSSRREAFSLALLEAGIFGLPVVATEVGGVPELIVDGETGYLVPPDSPAKMAEAMRRLLTNKIEAEEMGKRLRQRVIEDFSWEKCFGGYDRLASGAKDAGHA